MTESTLWASLRCPACRGTLANDGSTLRCRSCNTEYPIIGGIPRFAGFDNYAASFGYQWNRFRKLQLDSYNGSGFSEERFHSISGWDANDLGGKMVLDAGCGAGRFAEIVAGKYGANLIAFDLSSAVDACRETLGGSAALVCQASIYEPPFAEKTFDFVYSIGVVQHTPDPIASIRSLCRLVKRGGQIGLWIYEVDWKTPIGTTGFKYALRPLVKRLSTKNLMRFCQILVMLCYPILAVARTMGTAGKALMRLLPVSAAHLQGVKLSYADFRTWVLLDTFDMYSPAYDKPQRFSTVAEALAEEGFVEIVRHPHGAISVTARRA